MRLFNFISISKLDFQQEWTTRNAASVCFVRTENAMYCDFFDLPKYVSSLFQIMISSDSSCLMDFDDVFKLRVEDSDSRFILSPNQGNLNKSEFSSGSEKEIEVIREFLKLSGGSKSEVWSTFCRRSQIIFLKLMILLKLLNRKISSTIIHLFKLFSHRIVD
jgi:hypothetical protein